MPVLVVNGERVVQRVMVIQFKVCGVGQIGIERGFDVGGGGDDCWQFGLDELRADFGLVKLKFEGLALLGSTHECHHSHKYGKDPLHDRKNRRSS